MAYHRALACISSPKVYIINRRLYYFRNDDIQDCVLMICNASHWWYTRLSAWFGFYFFTLHYYLFTFHSSLTKLSVFVFKAKKRSEATTLFRHRSPLPSLSTARYFKRYFIYFSSETVTVTLSLIADEADAFIEKVVDLMCGDVVTELICEDYDSFN